MLSLYEYPTLILLIYTCAITLATDSPSKIPTIHHKNLLKHRAPPPDSGFDYSSLVACNKDTDCLVWQVCAICTKKTFGTEVKYCSEATERGLCGHGDETMICNCPQPNLAEYASWTRAGNCQTDQDCENDLSPRFGSGTGFRCATCIKSFIRGQKFSWGNLCTRPNDKNPTTGEASFYCDPYWLNTCSCGQVRPDIALPGGTQETFLFAPPPGDHVVVGKGEEENNNNLFASAFSGAPLPALEEGSGGW